MPILSPPTSLRAPPPPPSSAVPLLFSSSSFPISRSPFSAFHFEANRASSPPIDLGRPFPPSPLSPTARPRRRRRLGAARVPPSPPEPGPPPENGSRRFRSVAASLSRLQDSVQIFFAVLFWMSLFFWASAWDRRNRPSKGSRSRR
ncbi:proline-rich receptor-like protein kinase PERK2 [Syzygium oleosum]|uniref:proline-rich receptor-like protein kinase PERK2 n=1 Tax=Syzygium oleosum TaxID=219896 RepID=UPI0011D1FE85|nr:proline-rich receptor-like protein kinase PERK2 [Syzygium oleosum]